MLRHVVLLTLHPDAPADQPAAIVEHLATLPEAIPEIRSYSARVDLGLHPDNAHVCVIAEFDDEAGFVTYRDHPEHRRVIEEQITPFLARRTAVQTM